MRLPEEQIRQGILHSDVDVRFVCLHHFAEGDGRDTSVMPVAIEALERFGRTTAFRFVHPIADLPQTPATIQWVVRELHRPGKKEDDENFLNALFRLLCRADPRLVQPHVEEIRKAPGFSQKYSAVLDFRSRILAWDGPALWDELERICEERKSEQYVEGGWFGDATHVVEALARQGDRHVDRMMSLLGEEIESYENNPLTWMELLVVRLAGELRHEPAIPFIIEKLHEDGDLLSEECQTALARIGSDAVIEAIEADYPIGEWPFRLFAAGALGRVHSDRAVQAGIELLRQEDDADLRDWLAQSLVEQFSFEGNEAAREILLEDPDAFELQCKLVSACTLMEQGFPELEEWRQEIREKNRRKPFHFGGEVRQAPAPTAPRPAFLANGGFSAQSLQTQLLADRKVGRNDLCPCGSGKKYKKCCIDKGS